MRLRTMTPPPPRFDGRVGHTPLETVRVCACETQYADGRHPRITEPLLETGDGGELQRLAVAM